jgi:hypothetical protein
MMTPTFVALNEGRELQGGLAPSTDMYDYPGRELRTGAVKDPCGGGRQSDPIVPSRAAEAPRLGDMTPAELSADLKAWTLRNGEGSFDPVKVVEQRDVPMLRALERIDLLMAVLPAFAKSREGTAPAPAGLMLGAPRPEWDPSKETRSMCTAPMIALKYAVACGHPEALGVALQRLESARDRVGRSVMDRVHEAASGSARIVRALLRAGGVVCGTPGESLFPSPTRLFGALASMRAAPGSVLYELSDACSRWREIELATAGVAGLLRDAYAEAGRAPGAMLSKASTTTLQAALKEFVWDSAAMFEGFARAMSEAMVSARPGPALCRWPSVDVTRERATWDYALDLLAPDVTGVAAAYEALETMVGESGDALESPGAWTAVVRD